MTKSMKIIMALLILLIYINILLKLVWIF